MSLAELWAQILWPLCKLIGLVSVGLFVGNLIEACTGPVSWRVWPTR